MPLITAKEQISIENLAHRIGGSLISFSRSKTGSDIAQVAEQVILPDP